MRARVPHMAPAVRRHRAGPLGILFLLFASLLLTSCQPVAQPTLPPATQVKAAPVVATAAPAAQPPTAAPVAAATTAPTQAASQGAKAGAGQRQAVAVTILHTNDVMGEIDPCG